MEWQTLEARATHRMTHRSDLPRIHYDAVGGVPSPAKALQLAATTSIPSFEAEESHLENLGDNHKLRYRHGCSIQVA
jgi:hypothetical protein